MSEEIDSEFVEELRLSKQKFGALAPIILDKDGNIVEGHHRNVADPTWPKITFDNIKTEEDKVLFAIAFNWHRREKTDSWKTNMLSWLASHGYSIDQIVEKTGLSKRTIYRYLPAELKGPEPDELARAKLAREKMPETPKEPQIEEKPLTYTVPCSVCSMGTTLPKKLEGRIVCPTCFDKLSRGEIILEQPLVSKPPSEAPPTPPPRVEKRVYEPGAFREEMHKPVSRMDQWLAEELSRRGVAIRSQEPICIKFVVPEVIIEKGDKPLAVFLDTAETHGKRTLADMENRELLAKRGFRVLELQYDAYTEEQRQLIISEVMSAIQ
mgnify:FL=1